VIPKIISTAFKAALLASTLLCIGVSSLNKDIGFIVIPLCLLSIFVTFAIATILTLFTIIPFNEFIDDLNAIEKFNRYFPFYAIIYFLGCFYIIYNSNFEQYTTLIFGITYITAMQSWVWFFKQKTT